ncbi:Uncharacterised protein [Legionella wadsworthii]|uniref:Uncharacterized protein n=1 Tax=Legionella wadsworthii TaxID=28088 RepID=A0A378LSV4_9GAMM|nr:hypothetical protein [Legionella wadsworthii]STY29863.1 Uncharacterised protein [Legionella wadsworthii]
MTYSKRFFINPSTKKTLEIYKLVSNELKRDMSHIDISYKDILDGEDNPDLLNQKEEIQSRVNNLLSNFTHSFLKDSTSLFKEVCNLKVDILQLKTKFMIQHVLFNHGEFDIYDYNLVVNLHNCLVKFQDKVNLINWDQFAQDREAYIAIHHEYFDEVYSVLREQYDSLKDEFSIGDIWENWSYDADSSSEEEDSDDSLSPK